jgi:hydrogenase-4 component F
MISPFVVALIAALLPSNRWRPWLPPIGAAIHFPLTLMAVFGVAEHPVGAWIGFDPAGKLVLLLISALFLMTSIYLIGYLKYHPRRENRVFVFCLLCTLGSMTMVAVSRHLGLMWVSIEATALCTAPLIYFNKTTRSIEATWKYLLIGFVGIALALLGTLCLAYSSLHAGLQPSLAMADLIADAPMLSKPWLHVAFVLMLVGYGTKMGLAPMHTWKPDAYGAAPGAVGTLLAGGVTGCAFLCVLRIYQVCVAAGEFGFISPMLIFMGLFSMAVAGIFMVGQKDYKRMLAYSSVEHMGILVLGLGFGVPALFGTLLHLFNNGLTKGVLFLSAANIHRSYGSTTLEVVRGVLRRLPLSGGIFLAGFLAITGSPPFGPFISEFSILNAGFGTGRFVASGLFLFFLLVVFIGMGSTVLPMLQGKEPETTTKTIYREGFLTIAPPLVLLGAVLMIGLWIPGSLHAVLQNAVDFLEVQP